MTLFVENISIGFGGVRALDGVSLAADAARVTALIGPNGAGKSTLINVVTGAYRASQGTVKIDTTSLSGLRRHEIAKAGVARTFQNVVLFDSMTVRENLRVATDAWTRDAQEAHDYVERCLDRVGLDQDADRIVRGMPFGTRRMVEIGRALCLKPRYLLLDEPASGLNEGEKVGVKSIVDEIRRDGVGILLIEHNMPFVMDLADHVYCLHYGQNLADGGPADIQRDTAVVEAYLGRSSADA